MKSYPRKLMTALAVAGALLLSVSSDLLAQSNDALPKGRVASPIVDGNYPASYFPNTEILGEGEMRITALGRNSGRRAL